MGGFSFSLNMLKLRFPEFSRFLHTFPNALNDQVSDLYYKNPAGTLRSRRAWFMPCNLLHFVVFCKSRFWRQALHTTAGGWPHFPKGGEAMRITMHIGSFTVTIIIKKRKNRHSAKWRFRAFAWFLILEKSQPLVAVPFSILIISIMPYDVKPWALSTGFSYICICRLPQKQNLHS